MYMAKKFVDGNKEISFSELLEGNKIQVIYYNSFGTMANPVIINFEETHLKELRLWITQQLNKVKK